MKALLLAAAAVAAVMISSPSQAQTGPSFEGPSFNCAYAKAPDEVLICQHADLAALDREMAKRFFEMSQPLTAAERREMRKDGIDWPTPRWWKADQAKWLKSRRACGYNHDCIRTKYEERIATLNDAVKMVEEHFLAQRRALTQAEQLQHLIFLAAQMHAGAVHFDRLGVEIDH